MRRETALRILRENAEALRGLGVGELYLYGSVARDEADADSDVDLLVEPATEKFGIWELVIVKERCSEVLGVEADVHDYGGYQRIPAFRKRVAPDIIQVF